MQNPAARFEDLVGWQKSHALTSRTMNISQASLEELRYYFILSRDLAYLEKDEQWTDLDEVARMLGAYVRSLGTPAPSS